MKNLVVVGTLALFTAGAVLADVEEVLCGLCRLSWAKTARRRT